VTLGPVDPVASPRDAFARTVRALEPYAEDVVLIGGWVHALLLASVNDHVSAIYTDDIDITIPRRLIAAGRPTLVELATEAGFEIDPLSDIPGSPIRLIVQGPGGTVIDLDIMAEASTPHEAVRIDGQPDLAAQGYPGQQFLLDHAQWVAVGPDVHPLLDPPTRVRIPTVGAYVIHKGLSSATRTRRAKVAKDLVYLYEILRHPTLGHTARAEIRELAAESAELVDQWAAHLSSVLGNEPTLREMASQLLLAGRTVGSEPDVIARMRAVLRLAVGEARA
jgi:hypothetical protein